VRDLEASRAFYGGVLGCEEGRSAEGWVDFDFYGHQLVCHRVPAEGSRGQVAPVDGDAVPIPHCGVVLSLDVWRRLAERLRASGVAFRIEPRLRFAGAVGEQGTFFVEDPSGNVLEFKGFADQSQLFARDPSTRR
jgi:extradiol dioxygenase family protein